MPSSSADLVEGVVFVDHRPADAQHVHAGVARLHQRRNGLRRGHTERHRIQRRPARAAAEHWLAVDNDAEPVVAAVDRDGPKADRSEVDAGDLQRIERRLAMGMRPPPVDAGDLECGGAVAQRGVVVAAVPAEDDAAGAGGRHLQDAATAIEPGGDPGLRSGVPLDPYRSPRADRRRRRRPPGRAAKQRRAPPAELLVGNHRHAPARPRPALGQTRGQRPAVNHQLVVVVEAHQPAMGREHALDGAHRRAVEGHVGNGGDAVETQRDLASRRPAREPHAPPPVFGVELTRRTVETPSARRAQGRRRRGRGRTREPVGRRAAGLGRAGFPPISQPLASVDAWLQRVSSSMQSRIAAMLSNAERLSMRSGNSDRTHFRAPASR